MSSVYAELHDSLELTSGPSAAVLVPLLLELAPIRSVVDVGCGRGWFLEAFLKAGVPDVHGIDSAGVDLDLLRIPARCFEARDLSSEFSVARQFDLAMSLEVAEHLPESSADVFVDCLVALAPLVVFSAAVPGQGGVQHINEQWPSYWIERFARCGYRCRDVIRPRIWTDDRVSWWYRQNTLVFECSDGSPDPAGGGILDVVHPELVRHLQWEQAQLATERRSPRKLVQALPGAIRTSIERRVRRP